MLFKWMTVIFQHSMTKTPKQQTDGEWHPSSLTNDFPCSFSSFETGRLLMGWTRSVDYDPLSISVSGNLQLSGSLVLLQSSIVNATWRPFISICFFTWDTVLISLLAYKF